MLVRCNLAEASAPVEVNHGEGDGWQTTQYQCADCRHTIDGLVEIGKELAAVAMESPAEDFDCDWYEVEEKRSEAFMSYDELSKRIETHGDLTEEGHQRWCGCGRESTDEYCRIASLDGIDAAIQAINDDAAENGEDDDE